MKIVINKEKILALLVLLPYIEGNFLQNNFDIYLSDSTYIKAIIFVMIIVTLFFSIITSYRRTKLRYYGIILIVFCLFSLLYSIIFTSDAIVSLCSWLWLCIPMIYANASIMYIRKQNLDIAAILIQMVKYFTSYVVLVVIYYVLFRNLFFDSSIRLNPRGGGAVVFGYTIAVIFALTLQLKHSFKLKEYYLILVILTIGALGTKSRASIWPIIFCWIANFAFTKTDRKKVLISVFVLIPLMLVFSSIDFSALFSSTSYVGWQRLFNFHSNRRMETFINVFKLEMGLSLFKKLFGYGLGNFFPYLYWVINVNDVDNNMFITNRLSFLVQPHNSFLYFMVETGMIGFICIVLVFIFSIKKIMKNKEQSNYIYQLIFFGIIVFVNCFDSIFFVQPGVAGLYWLIIFLVVERHLQIANKDHSLL